MLLEVRGLGVRFRAASRLRAALQKRAEFLYAVNSVSFSLARGETMALVGESGSGKSTLALGIAGLLPAARGSIRFDGADIAGQNAAARRAYQRRISMIWQNPVGSLSPRLTVGSLVTEPLRIHRAARNGNGRGSLRDEAARLLQMVGLPPDFAARYPHQLSGGQARRVGVARALALTPDLIIADEPTAGLDVSVQGEILNLLNKLQAEHRISMLIITHNLNIVRHIADQAAIMYLGGFVEQGPAEKIFARPLHPYTRALLSANPAPDPDSAARAARVELQGEVPSLLNRPGGCEFHTRCPFVRSQCRSVAPPLLESDRRLVSCHYAAQNDAGEIR